MGDTFSAVFIVILILTDMRRPTIKLVYMSFLFELQMLSSYHPSLVKLLSNIFLISPYLFNTSTQSNLMMISYAPTTTRILRPNASSSSSSSSHQKSSVYLSARHSSSFFASCSFAAKSLPRRENHHQITFTQSPRLSTRLGGPRRIERPQNRHILNHGLKKALKSAKARSGRCF